MIIKQIQPFIGKEEADAVYETVLSTQLSEGPKTAELEKQISNTTGYYSMAVSNWTDGLILCIETLKKHKKLVHSSQIIIPNLTFVASINSALFCGLKPIVLDVDLNGQLDPNIVEDCLKKNKDIEAIMLVDLYGSCPDLDAFNDLSKKYNVSIIEDAAQAFGTYYGTKNIENSYYAYQHVGAYCDNSIGGFSFYSNKQLACGEGGIFVTKNREYYNTALAIKQHGSLTRGTFRHEYTGLNFRIDDVRSTILLEQLKKKRIIFSSKKMIHDFYQSMFEDELEMFPHESNNIKQNYWFSNILIESPTKLKNFLREHDIECRDCFLPLNRQECYKDFDFAKNVYPNSDYLYNHMLSLPSHPLLQVSDLAKVADLVLQFMTNERENTIC
jgi:dTDP-4-amino-4,6-dideoxygalactose transaminase